MNTKKVLLVGYFGVGKTSLIRRYVHNEFSEEYISTIGVRVSSKLVEVKDEEIKLLIWDVSGTHGDEKVPKSYFLGASAAMFVFDVSRESTYMDIAEYLESLKEMSGLDEIVIVGNKKDLITEQELEELKASIPVKIDILTSAKENNNVNDAFDILAQHTFVD